MTSSLDQKATTKEQMLRAISALPDNATIEDGIERLHLLYKIQVGMEQAAQGLVLTQEEMEKQFDEWLR